MSMTEEKRATKLAEQLKDFIREDVKRLGTTVPRNPGHRHPFHWPPHPVSYGFRVTPSDWTGRETFKAHGESFDVEVATTPYGVFGRSVQLWHEAKGTTVDDMLRQLKLGAEPLFRRQFAISECIGQTTRFTGSIRDLDPLSLLRLLFCSDRDVAHEAHTDIESRASTHVSFGPALVAILEDETHPNRRSAQWCVLDLFEDLERICVRKEDRDGAISAMKQLIWNATDDYARTTFKAGVVLGGHMPGEVGGPVLLECLHAPSKYGRRSAIHGLFHVVEWQPHLGEKIATELRTHSNREADPKLAEFAKGMANDIINREDEHVDEPIFPEEMS